MAERAVAHFLFQYPDEARILTRALKMIVGKTCQCLTKKLLRFGCGATATLPNAKSLSSAGAQKCATSAGITT